MSKIKIGNVKGQDGFSPTVKENPNNTDDNYRLDVTDKDGTFTTPNLKVDSEIYATKVQVDELKGDIASWTSDCPNLAIIENFTTGNWYHGYPEQDVHYFRTKGVINSGIYRIEVGLNPVIFVSVKDNEIKVINKDGIYKLDTQYYMYSGDGVTDYSDNVNLENAVNLLKIINLDYNNIETKSELNHIKSKIYGDEADITIPKEEYPLVGILVPNGSISSDFTEYRTSLYIPIDNIKRIYGVGFPTESYSCMSLYDENLNIIQMLTGEYDIDVKDIPNVKYFRASIDLNDDTYNCTISYKNKNDVSLFDEIEELKREIGYVVYDGDYNYLAIGNSITWHGKTSYWWNECGMAATTAENDYYHLICNHLNQAKGNVCSHVTNFSIWETQAHDRAETFESIKKYMSNELDLITIQLSENVIDYTTWEADYVELVSYIKQKSPNAQIILIGDFWNTVKTDVKERVAQQTNVQLANLNEIVGNTSYQCGIGTIVYDEEGNSHTVEHDGVAMHPGDSGMGYIANKVIELIN